MIERIKQLLELIRFSHTIFALPFAILAAVMALVQPLPNGARVTLRLQDGVGILLCMVFARSAAMAFNRLVDHRLDALNERTKTRHLPQGQLSRSTVLSFVVLNSVGFIAATLCFLPNRLPLFASVPVLLFLLGYSLAKRFTTAVHLWLGAALSLAPICVWVALRGLWPGEILQDLLPAMTLAGAVATWVAGFDIIYACQDAEFDREAQLFSVPARFGVAGALRIAAGLHLVSWGLLAILPVAAPSLGLQWIYGAAVLFIGGLLVVEHRLVRPDDLARVNLSFFHVNAVISVVLLVAGAIDCFV